jgi:dTDP-4-amino-4,6-dideoxygalactose transaminase
MQYFQEDIFILETNNCLVSEDISKRVLCLPVHVDLSVNDIDRISSIVLKAVSE